jgi:hypothetical protein
MIYFVPESAEAYTAAGPRAWPAASDLKGSVDFARYLEPD